MNTKAFPIKYVPHEVVARYSCTSPVRRYGSTEIVDYPVDWNPFQRTLNDYWNALKKCKQENDAAGKETFAEFEMSPHGLNTDWRHTLRTHIRVDSLTPEKPLEEKFLHAWEKLSKQAYEQRHTKFFESSFQNVPPS